VTAGVEKVMFSFISRKYIRRCSGDLRARVLPLADKDTPMNY